MALGRDFAGSANRTASREQANTSWELPKGFPKPKVPTDNPMTDAKVRLGRYLFYDKRMSVNGTESCATCHRQELAFTDGKPQAVGATGQLHPRGAMSLVNVAYSAVLTWSNPNEHSLEHQALTPMFGDHPVELGLTGNGEEFIQVLRSDAVYREMFPAAFPSNQTLSPSPTSPKPLRRLNGRSFRQARPMIAITMEATIRLSRIQRSAEKSCFSASRFPVFAAMADLTSAMQRIMKAGAETRSSSTTRVCTMSRGALSYPLPNVGIYEYTLRPEDVGKFKAPTLRNIALTAPYMHDGSAKTLDAVLDHYSAGGRTIADSPICRRGLSQSEQGPVDSRLQTVAPGSRRSDCVLDSLTDEGVIHDQKFGNPWKTQK